MLSVNAGVLRFAASGVERHVTTIRSANGLAVSVSRNDVGQINDMNRRGNLLDSVCLMVELFLEPCVDLAVDDCYKIRRILVVNEVFVIHQRQRQSLDCKTSILLSESGHGS
jgi:hypothetical protein